MKKLIVWVFLIGSFGFGQNFFESEEPEYDEPTNSSSMFQTQPEYDEPDQGVDVGMSNPGEEVPIDKWIFLLPIAGIVISFYYLRIKPKNI